MATGLTAAATARSRSRHRAAPDPGWSRADTLRGAAWCAAGILARAPLAARVEGVLDHDQSVVGLMALDIAAGRRWPIFFDGQRYMGAVEPYVAALMVKLLGHAPSIVALAPLLFFGLFVAGQYAVWRLWSDRATGHWAAVVALLSAPMPALWSVVPRGGYIELLAWALPVLAVYHTITRPGHTSLSPAKQAGWGFLIAVGYFLNPLSLIVYTTLAVDWALGRHGAELSAAHRAASSRLRGPAAPLVWCVAVAAVVVVLALFCHVAFRPEADSVYVFCMDRLPPAWAAPIGAVGIAGVMGAVVVWSGVAGRVRRLLPAHPWFGLGALAALVPSAVYNVLVLTGRLPFAHSMPIWIRAPWDVTPNVRDGFAALGPLIGCAPSAPATVLAGQGVALPPVVWPSLARVLTVVSPAVAAAVVLLLARLAWCDRRACERFWRLEGSAPTSGTVLALLGLAVTAALYLLQATSPNSSSSRYLVPAWIFLPGLVASALRSLPRPVCRIAALFLMAAWGLAQVNLWAEIGRDSPLRPLADGLQARGVRVILAETPVALMVANLSRGVVGAVEFRPKLARLGDRYARRFAPGAPVICVVDTALVWRPGEDPAGALRPSLGPRVAALADRSPARVRLAWRTGPFEVWELALPLEQIVREDCAALLPTGPASTNLSAGTRPRR
jgi:hypothetical protein